jgi:hypothetical protein
VAASPGIDHSPHTTIAASALPSTRSRRREAREHDCDDASHLSVERSPLSDTTPPVIVITRRDSMVTSSAIETNAACIDGTRQRSIARGLDLELTFHPTVATSRIVIATSDNIDESENQCGNTSHFSVLTSPSIDVITGSSKRASN